MPNDVNDSPRSSAAGEATILTRPVLNNAPSKIARPSGTSKSAKRKRARRRSNTPLCPRCEILREAGVVRGIFSEGFRELVEGERWSARAEAIVAGQNATRATLDVEE